LLLFSIHVQIHQFQINICFAFQEIMLKYDLIKDWFQNGGQIPVKTPEFKDLF